MEKYYWKNIDENIDRKIIDGKNIKRKMLMEKYLWKNTDKKYLQKIQKICWKNIDGQISMNNS